MWPIFDIRPLSDALSVDLMTFSVIKLLKNNFHKKDNKKTINNNNNNNEKCCKYIYVNSLLLFILTPPHWAKQKTDWKSNYAEKNSLHAATTYLFTWHRQNRVDIMTMELGKRKKLKQNPQQWCRYADTSIEALNDNK